MRQQANFPLPSLTPFTHAFLSTVGKTTTHRAGEKRRNEGKSTIQKKNCEEMKNKRDRNSSSFSSRLLRLARQPDKAYKTGRITAELCINIAKISFFFIGAHTSHVSMHLFFSARSRDWAARPAKTIFQRKNILGFILQIDSIYFYTRGQSLFTIISRNLPTMSWNFDFSSWLSPRFV